MLIQETTIRDINHLPEIIQILHLSTIFDDIAHILNPSFLPSQKNVEQRK